MKLVQHGKPIKNQLAVVAINIFVSIKIKIVKEIQYLVVIFVLSIIYRMRSKTFRRKHGKMSRRRRGGQNPTNMLGRTTTADYINMEEGFAPTAPPMEQMGMLGRSNTAELDNMEQGYASKMEGMDMMGRSNTSELNAMEEGYANPQVAIDVESTPDIEMGLRGESGGRKRRKTRKARKGRKSRKSRKSRRR